MLTTPPSAPPKPEQGAFIVSATGEVRLNPDLRLRRRRALDAARRIHGQVDAVVVCDLLDIHYLTGTRHGISWLALTDHSAFAVSRHMLVDEVVAEAFECEILLPSERSTDRPDLEQFVIGQLAKHGLESVVVDPARITASSFHRISTRAAEAGLKLLQAPELLAPVRAVKDAGEIALTRHCVAIAEKALSDLLAQGAGHLIGKTERQLADELESRMWALGADRQGFPETGIIVASGPNSASPHHTPGPRRVNAGEALLFDWGAEVAGYRSDLTRTVFPVKIADFALKAYPVVEQALLRAAQCLRAGAAMGDVDQAARDTVVAAGYPEFHYGVGHGVGLAIHEAPWLRAHSTEICQTDMLTTIEPGIYLPGIGGIRIENVYHVLDSHSQSLGHLPTDLAAMVIG